MLGGWMEGLYHGFVWVPSLFFAALPLFAGVYGPAGAWCWIKSDSQVWRLCMLYIPLLLLFGFVIFLYVWMAIRVYKDWKEMKRRGQVNDLTKQRHIAVFKRLSAYPFIFILVWIFSIVNRLYDLVSDDNSIFLLAVLQCIFMPLQGFINALAFALDKEILGRLNRAELMRAIKTKIFCAEEIGHQQMVEFPMEDLTGEDDDEDYQEAEKGDLEVDEDGHEQQAFRVGVQEEVDLEVEEANEFDEYAKGFTEST